MASASESFQNSEALFAEIVEFANEYSTHQIQDWDSIKSDVLKILTTHRPTKIADQQFGLSNSLSEKQRLIVFEFEDKAVVREYSVMNRRCCDCSSSCFIDRYGIVFVKIEHECLPRQYYFVLKMQEQLKEKKLRESQSILSKHSVARPLKNANNRRSRFEEKLFNELFKSIKDYTDEEIDLSSKEEIFGLLKTHRPLKTACYQFGISKDGVKSIFAFDPNDNSRIYEYSKLYAPETMDFSWTCRKSYKNKCPPLIWKYGIVFTPMRHFCTSKKITKELSKRMQTKKSYGIARVSLDVTSSGSNHTVASESNMFSNSPVQKIANLHNDISFEKPPRLSRFDESTSPSVSPDAERPDEYDVLGYPVQRGNVTTSTTNIASEKIALLNVAPSFLNQCVVAENSSPSDLPDSFLDSLSKDVPPDTYIPSSSSTSKRNRASNDDIENLIFVDVKPPLAKKQKTRNVPSVLETTSFAVNKDAEEDECVVIDQKAGIISNSIYLEVPYQFEHPSASVLRQMCKKLCIDYSQEAYTFWGNIKFEQIPSDSRDLKLHEVKTKNIFECISLLFTGGTEQFFKIQHVLNQAFQDKLLSSGKMTQREIDQIFMTSAVSDAQLTFVTKFLGCRIAIFKESTLARYGKWDCERTVLTLVLSYFNGVYSVVLNL